MNTDILNQLVNNYLKWNSLSVLNVLEKPPAIFKFKYQNNYKLNYKQKI